MLFHYKRTSRRQALTLAINILMLPVLLYGASLILEGRPQAEEIYPLIEKAAIAVGVALFGLMLWCLKSDKKFELHVTESEFHGDHPLFDEWCYTIDPQDIVRIEHTIVGTSDGIATIFAVLRNGDNYSICTNYNYSRKKLYAALKTANPAIELPENIYLFKGRRSKAVEQYLLAHYPRMTKFLMWLLRIKPLE